MKYINKVWIRYAALAIICILLLTGCSNDKLIMEYASSELHKGIGSDENKITGFADNLCVTTTDVIPEGMPVLETSAGLFGVDTREVIYANRIHERMYPASLTKVMTALVLLENYSGDFSDTLTASKNIYIKETGAQLCGFKEGDTVTLDQALRGLLMYSGNDAAVMVAEYVAGSVDEFVKMMNQKAIELGATKTHFTNPHGLSDKEHYTTAYDLYLIFQEAIKYDKFRQIIHEPTYQFDYQGADGNKKSMNWKTTNLFLNEERTVPESVVLIGGKTGTTAAAGSCLITLSQNMQNEDFICVVLKAKDKTSLYDEMSQLLMRIND